MIRGTVQTILNSVSQTRLMDTVDLVAGYHRIQASQGFRDAARAIADDLKEQGISARVDSYPAAYGVRYMTMGVFPEWNCSKAHCRLIAPEAFEMADYAYEPISVIQKSFPYKGGPLEVVMMDRGCAPGNYNDIDFKGKLLFIREDFNAYLWAVKERGALGFISDYVAENKGVRTRDDMMDVRKYTTFWWENPPEFRPFGFVITPRMGDKLAAICRMPGARPMADCFVDASFSDGALENLVAELPGETDEEVWLIAHLCHPKPSANDNASGVAAALEALQVIRHLVDTGTLPPPKRSLKVLLVPEFTGIYAHLSRMKTFHRTVAALNLDMVGGRQELGYGPLTLSGLSSACPSLAFDLSKYILNVLRQETQGFSLTTRVPRFNSAVCGFTAGSDHFILQDPTVGIPTPMLGQWPDLFYHTSGDTKEMISPGLLQKSAALAASYGYLMCTMNEKQLHEILLYSASSFVKEMAGVLANGTSIPSAQAREYILQYYLSCAQSGERLVPGAASLVQHALERIHALDAAMAGNEKAAPVPDADRRVPRRTYVSPINRLASHTGGDPKRERAVREYDTLFKGKHPDSFVAEILIQYHMNGVHTVDDIIRRVLLEAGGGSGNAITAYIDTLAALGLCEFI